MDAKSNFKHRWLMRTALVGIFETVFRADSESDLETWTQYSSLSRLYTHIRMTVT